MEAEPHDDAVAPDTARHPEYGCCSGPCCCLGVVAGLVFALLTAFTYRSALQLRAESARTGRQFVMLTLNQRELDAYGLMTPAYRRRLNPAELARQAAWWRAQIGAQPRVKHLHSEGSLRGRALVEEYEVTGAASRAYAFVVLWRTGIRFQVESIHWGR